MAWGGLKWLKVAQKWLKSGLFLPQKGPWIMTPKHFQSRLKCSISTFIIPHQSLAGGSLEIFILLQSRREIWNCFNLWALGAREGGGVSGGGWGDWFLIEGRGPGVGAVIQEGGVLSNRGVGAGGISARSWGGGFKFFFFFRSRNSH